MSAHRISFVRHGETAGQSSIRYHGINDVPLNETGAEQMLRAARALSHLRFDRVFSSGLARTRAAAEIIAQSVEVEPLAELNEINFGRWEGLTKEEIAALDPELYDEWRARPDRFAFPEGDDRIGFDRRIADGLSRVLEAEPPGEWLMVLHRGVIAAALDHLLGARTAASLDIALGSLHIVSRNGDGWVPEKLDVLP